MAIPIVIEGLLERVAAADGGRDSDSRSSLSLSAAAAAASRSPARSNHMHGLRINDLTPQGFLACDLRVFLALLGDDVKPLMWDVVGDVWATGGAEKGSGVIVFVDFF